MWAHLSPWADAVSKGIIPGFFTTTNLRLPDTFPGGERAVAVGTAQGTLVCRIGLLYRLGARNSLHAGFLLAASASPFHGDAPARVALGPLASGGQLWFTAATDNEQFVFSAESQPVLEQMEKIVKRIVPTAQIERSAARPTPQGVSVLRAPGVILSRLATLPPRMRWRVWTLLVGGSVCAGLCIGLAFTAWSWLGMLIGVGALGAIGLVFLRRLP